MNNNNVLSDVDLNLSAYKENFSAKFFPKHIKVSKNNSYHYSFENKNTSNKNELKIYPSNSEMAEKISNILKKFGVYENTINWSGGYYANWATSSILDTSIKAIIIKVPDYKIIDNPFLINKNMIDEKTLKYLVGGKFINNDENFNLFIVKFRAQIFELTSILLENPQFSNADYLNSYFEELSKLESGLYKKEIFSKEPFNLEVSSLGFNIPIIENIDGDNWVFYKHNFETHKEKIMEKWGVKND